MNARDAVVQQFRDLALSKFNANRKLPIWIRVFSQPVDEGFRKLGFAQRSDSLDLRKIGNRQDARNDRNLDACCNALVAKVEEVFIDIEELGHNDVCSGIGEGVDQPLSKRAPQ